MALADIVIVCGTTYDDPSIEARIKALRRVEGYADDGGCGKNVRANLAYRCVECGRWFHRECILTHFTLTGDDHIKTILADLEEARRVCAEAYQIVGALGNLHPSTVPILDNLSAAGNGRPIPHATCLPFFATEEKAE